MHHASNLVDRPESVSARCPAALVYGSLFAFENVDLVERSLHPRNDVVDGVLNGIENSRHYIHDVIPNGAPCIPDDADASLEDSSHSIDSVGDKLFNGIPSIDCEILYSVPSVRPRFVHSIQSRTEQVLD